MDARITKERLGNFLSYDWLKIIAACIAAVFVVVVLFTTIQTRIEPSQRYSVYAYTDVRSTSETSEFAEIVKRAGVFSYEIQDVEAEAFANGGDYSGVLLTTRRSTGDGDAMFVTVQYAEDGSISSDDGLQGLIRAYPDLALDPLKFLADTETYLNGFFGGDCKSGELDAQKAEQAFRARNEGDKRFKGESGVKEGIEKEKERLTLLRKDFVAVSGFVESGLLPVVSVTDEKGETVNAAFSVSKLKRITKYFYHGEEDANGQTVASCENLCVMLFENFERDGELKYESVSFLRYLCENYAA